MKILHVYKRSLPQSIGGVEKFIDTLCKSSSPYGVNNKVLSLSRKPSKKINHNGYEVYNAKEIFYIGSTGFSIDAFYKFIKLSNEVDLIHHHYPHPFGDLLQILSLTKKPYLITYHSEKIYNPIKHYFLNNSQKIIATSPNYFATSGILKQYSSKVDVIPIGLIKKDYNMDVNEREEYWKKKIGSRFFLFLGAQRYYKGLNIALKAAENTNIKIVFAGAVGINLINKAKSNPNIQFLGQVKEEDKCALLKSCYGFIFPSNLRAEAFGIALLEAAYFEKPLISCEIGTGTSYVNKHGVTGFVVKPGDPRDLKEAMLKLLNDTKLADEMGKNAKIRALQLFGANKQAEAYLKIYSELLEIKI